MTETTTVSYRHEVNPALATNLLNDLQVAVAQQQQQLRRIIQQIKALYAEGPVVNGWLESSQNHSFGVQPESQVATSEKRHSAAAASGDSVAPPVDTSVLFRHGDVEDLMAYVKAMEPGAMPPTTSPPAASAAPTPSSPVAHTSPAATTATYCLCQLDKNGQVRAQPCPPEQVPTVSMAIVRHQKLVQLVAQKSTLEGKLKQVVDTLGDLKLLMG